MMWSDFQINIFDTFTKTDDNLVIEALAGSGKTTVIEQLNKLASPVDELVNVAFNVSIKDELRKRLPRHREVYTLNGAGWQAYHRARPKVIFNENKDWEWLRSQFDERKNAQFFKIQGTVRRLVDLFKQLNISSDTFPQNWERIADDFGIETGDFNLSDEFPLWLERLWRWSSNTIGIANYADQLYQPIDKGWKIAKRDIVLVDETQDLSPVKLELALQMGRRVIAVGDKFQIIYHFAGAALDSIDQIVQRTRAQTLPLSICYRCPKSVVEMAQRYVPQIQASPNAIEGEVGEFSKDDFWKMVEDGDYVTCRNTAPLVSYCLKAIRDKRKAFVRGRDLGNMLFSVLEKMLSHSNIESLVKELNDYKIVNVERLNRVNKVNEAESLADRVDTLLAICSYCDYPFEVPQAIDEIFSDETKNGIEFTTIHKAKGSERNRQWRLESGLCPNSRTPEHLMQIEYNLKYVEITRSKQFLGTIV